MSGVFRNIDPPSPHRPASVSPLVRGGRKQALGGEGWGFNSSEDARHCCTYVSTLCPYVNDEGQKTLYGKLTNSALIN
jgi:hypothetical protein